jgi:hypothetical protein
MKIRPDHPKRLPLVFDAGEELNAKSANRYVGSDGQPVGPKALERALRGGKRKVIALTLKVRYRSDGPDAPLRKVKVYAVVDSNITAEELGRIVHKMGRSMYAQQDDTP